MSSTDVSSSKITLDPPSGSYSAPVRITLVGPPRLISPFERPTTTTLGDGDDQRQNQNLALSATNWHISIEHIDRIEEVFDGPADAKHPPAKSCFLYEGPFRLTRAGRMRVCAWPQSGTYERDRVVAVYYVENPHDAIASGNWVVDKCPPSSVTHPVGSFQPFSFELSAAQRYLRPSSGGNNNNNNSNDDILGTHYHTLPATVTMVWYYDRQMLKENNTTAPHAAAASQQQQRQVTFPAAGAADSSQDPSSSSSLQPASFEARSTVRAEVNTTWEWVRGTRWSNDNAQDVDSRYCIRVSREGGFTKGVGTHGAWDAAVTTEAALPVPVQFDITPLGAVNAVVGIHSEETTTPTLATAMMRNNNNSSSNNTSSTTSWKSMDVSLHLASLSGTMELKDPEIMFRFYGHHPAPAAVRKPLFEGSVLPNAVLSLRVVPDQAGAAQTFCEVKLIIDGQYVSSAFFPKRSHVKASCLLSDPVMYSALQVVARAPTTHLKVSDVFFGAAPIGSGLDERRAVLQKVITYELNQTKFAKGTEAAQVDPTCSCLFVELHVDISPIEALPGGGGSSSSESSSSSSSTVPLSLYWRPTWMQHLPVWTVKSIGVAASSVLRLFALQGGRGVEAFEEAEEKNKNSPLLMQIT